MPSVLTYGFFIILDYILNYLIHRLHFHLIPIQMLIPLSLFLFHWLIMHILSALVLEGIPAHIILDLFHLRFLLDQRKASMIYQLFLHQQEAMHLQVTDLN